MSVAPAAAADRVPRHRGRWLLRIIALLLILLAVGMAGYAQLRGFGVGIALAGGGAEAREEEWRLARKDPRLRKELEERAAEEREFAAREEQVIGYLRWTSATLAVLGVASGIASLRRPRKQG